MKKILAILLGITLAAYSSMAFADDATTTIYISQSGDNNAKVCAAHPLGYDGSKSLGTVQIKFVDDATWDTVKRSYDVPASEATMLSCKGATLTVHGDGGISVSCPKTCKPSAAKK
jgi:hypothetical protein